MSDDEYTVVLTPQGQLETRRTQVIGRMAADPLLQQYIKTMPLIVKNLAFGWSVRIENTTMFAARTIDKIVLNTRFSIQDAGNGRPVIVPDFGLTPSSAIAKLDWTPPDGLRIVIGAYFSNVAMPLPERWFMFGLLARTAVLLPLPNLYKDGRACTGSTESPLPPPPATASLLEKLEHVRSATEASTWNTDLMTDYITAVCQRFFRWNKDFEQLPPLDAVGEKFVNLPISTNISRLLELIP